MERVKHWTETIILISVFAAFFSISIYFALIGNQFYIKILAMAAAMLFGKSVVLIFCRATRIMPEYKVQIYSCKATAFCICVFAIAVIIKFIS